MRVKTWLIVIAMFYLLACALPAYSKFGGEPVFGIVCLVLVPLVMLIPAWWANPLFFVGYWYLARGRLGGALACGVLALPLALSYFSYTMKMEEVQVGSYVWMAAILALPVAATDRLIAGEGSGKIPRYEEI